MLGGFDDSAFVKDAFNSNFTTATTFHPPDSPPGSHSSGSDTDSVEETVGQGT